MTSAHSDNPDSLKSFLTLIPNLAFVVDKDRKVIEIGRDISRQLVLDVDASLGKKPGELLNCLHERNAEGGCGTGDTCTHCGILGAFEDALTTGEGDREAGILSCRDEKSTALNLRVQARKLGEDAKPVVILFYQDLSSEKHKGILQKTFLHDIANTAGGISGIAEMLVEFPDSSRTRAFIGDLYSLSNGMIEEIRAFRELIEAEQGELCTRPEPVQIEEILDACSKLVKHHPQLPRREVLIEKGEPLPTILTDPVLVRRVVTNMLVNAVEATPAKWSVRVSTTITDDHLCVSVHNRGVIPDNIRHELFILGNSSKGIGRGIGTYSMKLLTDRYLRGEISFTSTQEEGTTFTLSLPRTVSHENLIQ